MVLHDGSDIVLYVVRAVVLNDGGVWFCMRLELWFCMMEGTWLYVYEVRTAVLHDGRDMILHEVGAVVLYDGRGIGSA